MPTFLDLPRELYLIICSYLTPAELTNLAGASRDHYLAAQQPLYECIRIAKYKGLIKLVETVNKFPVVSTISPQQRLRWYKLSDAELRERDIKHIDLTVSGQGERNPQNITGAVLARCIGAISRKCPLVKISLTLDGAWPNFVQQLERFAMPNVTKLKVLLTTESVDEDREPVTMKIWDLLFSGDCFSDIKDVYVETWNARNMTLDGSIRNTSRRYLRHQDELQKANANDDIVAPFYGLRKMERIVLAHTSLLNVDSMQSLFGSDIIPQRLTHLEIVDCPALHLVKDLTAICTLLARSLQLVKHLKVHLCKLHDAHAENTSTYSHNARIHEHPEEHPCNTIRKLGLGIPHLDLALPFACANVFPPAVKRGKAYEERTRHPEIPMEPYETLPARLREAGYKYRRLICWHGVCRGVDRWVDVKQAAEERVQGKTSWELLYRKEDSGTWYVGGCLPLYFQAQEVLGRPVSRVEEV